MVCSVVSVRIIYKRVRIELKTFIQNIVEEVHLYFKYKKSFNICKTSSVYTVCMYICVCIYVCVCVCVLGFFFFITSLPSAIEI